MIKNIDITNFKDSIHYDNFLVLLNEFKKQGKDVSNDVYYLSLCSLLSLINKDFTDYITLDGFDGLELLKYIKPYSKSEQIIIKLSLHLFNSSYDFDFTIDDLFTCLDKENRLQVLSALEFRFL